MATSSNRGDGDSGLERLLAELDSPDLGLRAGALRNLARLGPEAGAAVPRLAAMLADASSPEEGGSPGRRLSWDAIDALAAIGERALPTLQRLAFEADLNTAERAVLAAGGMPPELLEKAVPWLLEVVNRRRGDTGLYDGANVREAAARVLGQAATAAAAPLLELFERTDGQVCIEVAMALGALGEAGAPAVPRLIGMLGRTGEFESWKLLRVFGQIGPRAGAAMGVLVEHLDPRFPDVHRQMAAESLGRLGPEACEAVPALTGILLCEGAAPAVVAEAAAALGRMGPAARDAVPSLELCAQRGDAYVKGKAEAALALMQGPNGR